MEVHFLCTVRWASSRGTLSCLAFPVAAQLRVAGVPVLFKEPLLMGAQWRLVSWDETTFTVLLFINRPEWLPSSS